MILFLELRLPVAFIVAIPENAFLHMVRALAGLHATLWSAHALLRCGALVDDGCADAALQEQMPTEHVFPASPVSMLVSPFHVFAPAHFRTRAVFMISDP